MDQLADAAAKMKLQDEAELTGKSVQELALEKVVPIIQAEMEALESCGNFKSSKDHGLGDDFGFDKIQPLLEEMAPNLFEILMGAMSGATEDSEVAFSFTVTGRHTLTSVQEQAQDSTPADDEASSEVSSARVSSRSFQVSLLICAKLSSTGGLLRHMPAFVCAQRRVRPVPAAFRKAGAVTVGGHSG